MKLKLFLLTLFVSGLCAAQTVKLTPLSGKITLDGKLDEKIWQRKPDVEKFYPYGAVSKNFAPVSTRAYLAFDGGKYIYVAVRCEEPLMKSLSLSGKKTDDPVWKDDSVEFFFVPSPKKGIYTQIVINADGIVFDLCSRGDKREAPDRSWNSGTVTRTFKGKDYWSLEAKIPLENLPVDAPVADWKFHIARNRACCSELYSCVQGIDSFHNFSRFFNLPQVRIPSLKLTVTEYDMGEARYGTNRATVTLKNWSDSKLQAVLANKSSRKICSIEKNSTAAFTLDWDQALKNPLCDQELTISVAGKLLRRLTLKKELQELFINERDAVRFIPRNKPVIVTVPINLSSLSAPGYALIWRVADSNGTEMVSGQTTVNDGKALLRIFWSFMKAGSYKLELRLCRNGKTAASVIRDLRLVDSPFTGI